MEFGISTAAFYRRAATEDALCHIREQGASLCEVYLESFSEYTPDFAHLLRQRADALGLRVVSVHPMGTQFEPQLFSLSVRQHDDAWRIFERVMQSAQILGAKYYVMHGPPTMRGALKNAEAGRIGPIIAELCALAGRYGLRLAWENVSWCLFDSPSFPSSIEPYLNGAGLGYTFDVKQASRSGCDPYGILDAMGSRLCHLHACDVFTSGGRMFTAMPGKGSFDFARLGERLRQRGYQGAVMLEPYSDTYESISEIGAALRWLKKTMEPD